MKLKTNLKLIFLFLGFTFLQSCKAQKPIKSYLINKIDSTSLSYYYLINISPVDSLDISYNLLSNKINDSLSLKENITIGESYQFYLLPMLDMIEKRGNKDSVIFSPAAMKTIVINGILLFTVDYTVIPYSTGNLVGLKYINP